MEEAMELDAPPPLPQVACTDRQRSQVAQAQRAWSDLSCIEARMAETGAFFDGIIEAIGVAAGHVAKLRRLRAKGCDGADLAVPLRNLECAVGLLSAAVRKVVALRPSVVEMGRRGLGPGGGETAADALADAMQQIHIGLGQ